MTPVPFSSSSASSFHFTGARGLIVCKCYWWKVLTAVTWHRKHWLFTIGQLLIIPSHCNTVMERSPGWMLWASMRTLMFAVNVLSDKQGSHPDDLSIFVNGDVIILEIILGMGSANERCYIVTPPLIGRAHTQNDPCHPDIVQKGTIII